jgi:hypothetical protein
MKKTRFVLEAEYDPAMTDPEGLATALDRLLETACSTPGILEDYGNPTLGQFTLAEPPASDLIQMCRRVAGCAENWADCSDMREALAVFKELGQECRALLEDRPEESAIVSRYILYDFDSDDLATTNVYHSYDEAAVDASQLDNVIILALPFEMPTDETDEEEDYCECEEPGYFYSGVPGILAHLEDGRLAEGAKVERCDACCLYPDDEAALAKLIELGMARPVGDDN